MKRIIRIIASDLIISYDIIDATENDFNDVENFVTNEINGAPSYIKLVIKIFSLLLFYIYCISKSFKFFSENNTSSLILFLKNKKIPVLKELLTLYESLILLRLLEKTNKK